MIAIKAKKEYQEKLTNSESAYEDAERNVADGVQKVLAAARAPSNLLAGFAREMLSLKNALDHAKLPDSAAREFFEDLAEDPLCICGRPLDDASRQAVRDRAQLYLGSEDVGLLNQIKGEIASRVGSDPAKNSAEFEERLSTLQQATRTAALCRSAWDAINGYPVYDLDYRRNVRVMRDYFASVGIDLCGRFAEFEYINSDECIRRAIALANRYNEEAAAKATSMT